MTTSFKIKQLFNRLTTLLFTLLVTLVSNPSHSMTINKMDGHLTGDAYLAGEIKAGDLEKIKEYIRKEGYPRTIWITSPGGDVMEAIEISKFLRKTFLSVTPMNQCDSACFIIYSGSYKRSPSPFLGIHRPYFDREYFSDLSIEDSKTKYNKMLKYTTEHLKNMDIPTSLIETMISIDSNNMLPLSYEFVEENIVMYPPAQREWLISKCGSLTPREQGDLNAFWESANRQINSGATKIEGYSDGYFKYLRKNESDIKKCENKEINEVRAEIDL